MIIHDGDGARSLMALKDGRASILKLGGDTPRLTLQYHDLSWVFVDRSVRDVAEANTICRKEGWPELTLETAHG